jgi:hypothetical protein
MVEIRQASGRFFEKKLRKKLLLRGGVGPFGEGVDGRFRGHDGLKAGQGHQEQKFFAELFFKKATACF